jgi:hypothetical protein
MPDNIIPLHRGAVPEMRTTIERRYREEGRKFSDEEDYPVVPKSVAWLLGSLPFICLAFTVLGYFVGRMLFAWVLS